MDNNQIYRAPSLPKINRRNISSSAMSGAQSGITPKLKKSGFNFGRSKIDPSVLKSETTITKTLIETNIILVEIQKQLALDFANRIVEKKNALQSAKIRLTKERASRKEESLESGGKKEDGAFKPFDKIKEKTRNIFEKILDFFTIIATGLIVNNAFDWISKKENQEKVKQFVEFVAKYWKELLALFIGYKITKFILRIKKLTDLFRKKPSEGSCGCDDGKGGKGPKGPNDGPQDPCSPFRKCLDNIKSSNVESLAEKIANSKIFKPLFNLLPKSQRPKSALPTALPQSPLRSPIATPTPQASPTAPRTSPTAPRTSPTAPRTSPTAPRTSPGANKISPGPRTRIGGGRGGGGGGGLIDPIPPIDYIDIDPYDVNPPTPKEDYSPVPVANSKGGTIPKFSLGGSVGGIGSGNIDTVRAMLAPGEEVIRASAAMMFRPLLKDINDSAGKKWIEFSDSVRNMLSYNKSIGSSLDDLNENLKIFKTQLDEFVDKKKREKDDKNGGGGYGMRLGSSPKEPATNLILPTTIIHSDLKSPTRPVTRTTIPINLPTTNKTVDFKMPPIDGGMANDDPDISSVNIANEYMFLTPKMYGIFV